MDSIFIMKIINFFGYFVFVICLNRFSPSPSCCCCCHWSNGQNEKNQTNSTINQSVFCFVSFHPFFSDVAVQNNIEYNDNKQAKFWWKILENQFISSTGWIWMVRNLSKKNSFYIPFFFVCLKIQIEIHFFQKKFLVI